MARFAEKADPIAEAERKGMVISEPYLVPGRGRVCVATDRAFDSCEDFAAYVYRYRHDPSRVMFINPEAKHIYASGREQDIIALGIAKQEGVEVKSPFRSEAEKEERAQKRSFSVNYAGTPVHITMDVSGLGRQEREALQAAIDRIRFRRPGEALAAFENDFARFIEMHFDRIIEIRVKGVSVRLDEGTLSEINSLARRA